jgi:hypothetical protein
MAAREVRAQCLTPEICAAEISDRVQLSLLPRSRIAFSCLASQISDPVQLAVALKSALRGSGGMQKSPGIFPGLFLLRDDDLHRRLKFHQVQTITPVTLVQVLADSEWTLLALHACGGPATSTAVIVTFCEGVKPCMGVNIVATPAK